MPTLTLNEYLKLRDGITHTRNYYVELAARVWRIPEDQITIIHIKILRSAIEQLQTGTLAVADLTLPKRKSEIPFCPLKLLEAPRSRIMSENFGRFYGHNQEDTHSPPDPDPNNGEEADWFSVFTEDEGDK